MSEQRFDMHQVLRVFAIVTQYGVRDERGYVFEGLIAKGSEDGYTVEISDNAVTLSVYFHNTYDVQFETQEQLDQFQLKLKAVEEIDKERQSVQ
mgnify:CR=1 FL=1